MLVGIPAVMGNGRIAIFVGRIDSSALRPKLTEPESDWEDFLNYLISCLLMSMAEGTASADNLVVIRVAA